MKTSSCFFASQNRFWFCFSNFGSKKRKKEANLRSPLDWRSLCTLKFTVVGEFLHLDFNLWIFQFSQAWARRIVLVQFPLQSLKSSVLSLPLSSLSLSLSYLSAYLSIYLLYLSMIYLSIYLSAVSIYLSTATIYLAIYQSIYLSI